MKTLEERRSQTRICMRKYRSFTINPETKQRERTNEVYVYVNGELVPVEESYYLEKDLYVDKNVPESIEKDGAYIDRMKQWDSIKFNECNAKLEFHISSGGTIQGNTVGNIEKFLSLYNGYPCRLTLVKENKGYNGYYYTYLQWIKISDLDDYSE